MSVQKKKHISDRIAPSVELATPDVWTAFSPAAGLIPKNAISLGQGFMNWAPADFARKAFAEALETVPANHYAPPKGVPALREALCRYLSPSMGRALNPETEVIVTSGANGGMYAAAAAFLNPGDEVIIFEPFFDQYIAQISFHGAVPVCVPIVAPESVHSGVVEASEWKIDMELFRKAISPKTKMIWLNTPQNPIGKVFSEEELKQIAEIAIENDIIVMSDEVYDCLTYNQHVHKRIASIDGMWSRTLTVGSAGKSFAATGWRVGWVVGPEELVKPTMLGSTRIVYCSNTAAQIATAKSLDHAMENGFFEKQTEQYAKQGKLLMDSLDKLGLPYTVPHGSYFILVDVKKINLPEDINPPEMFKQRSRDWTVAWFVAQTTGVVILPMTDFYEKAHWSLGENFCRLAFCKDEKTIELAGAQLQKLRPYLA